MANQKSKKPDLENLITRFDRNLRSYKDYGCQDLIREEVLEIFCPPESEIYKPIFTTFCFYQLGVT